MTVEEFNKGTLEKILNGFALGGRVFTNEAQFQFELGRAIKEEFNDVEVLFEVLSIDKKGKNTRNKKVYTDLVLSFGEKADKKYVAIELKYKSTSKSKGLVKINGTEIKAYKYSDDQYVFPQGAEDEGSFAFLKDIHRLEEMVRDEGNIEMVQLNKRPCKGFAIFLANSELYWKKIKGYTWSQETDVKEGPLHNNSNHINLFHGRSLKNVNLNWRDGCSTRKDEGVQINGTYLLNWEDYNLDNSECEECPDFKYLIAEVPPKQL